MAWPTPNYYDYDKGVVLVLVLGNNILAAWSRVGVVVVVVVVWAVAVDVGLGRAVVDKELKVVGGAGGVAGDLDLELADEIVLVDPWWWWWWWCWWWWTSYVTLPFVSC